MSSLLSHPHAHAPPFTHVCSPPTQTYAHTLPCSHTGTCTESTFTQAHACDKGQLPVTLKEDEPSSLGFA